MDIKRRADMIPQCKLGFMAKVGQYVVRRRSWNCVLMLFDAIHMYMYHIDYLEGYNYIYWVLCIMF